MLSSSRNIGEGFLYNISISNSPVKDTPCLARATNLPRNAVVAEQPVNDSHRAFGGVD